jgi:hypothetical protein
MEGVVPPLTALFGVHMKRALSGLLLLLAISCGGTKPTPQPPPTPPPAATLNKGYFRVTQPKTAANMVKATSSKAQMAQSTISTNINRMQHSALRMANGRVLVAGGYNFVNQTEGSHTTGGLNIPLTERFQVFDPITESFVGVGVELPVLDYDPDDPDVRDPVTGQVINMVELHTNRNNPSLVEIPDGRVLIVGGGQNSLVEAYDPSTNKVTTLADLRNYVGQAGNTSWQTFSYTEFTYSHSFYFNGKLVVLSQTTLYTLDLNTLEITASLDPTPDHALLGSTYSCSLVIGDKGYILGGQSALLARSNKVLAVDSDFNLTQIATLSSARVLFGCAALDSTHIGIYGGFTGAETLDDVEVIDLATGQTSLVGHLPMAGLSFTTLRLQNGYVFNGGGSGADRAAFLNTQMIYDHTSNVGGFTNLMNRARRDSTATYLENGRVLIVGGELNNTSPVTEIFEPNTAIYIKIPNGGPWNLGATIHLTLETALQNLEWNCSSGSINADGDFTFPTSIDASGLVKITVIDPTNADVNKAEVYLKVKDVIVQDYSAQEPVAGYGTFATNFQVTTQNFLPTLWEVQKTSGAADTQLTIDNNGRLSITWSEGSGTDKYVTEFQVIATDRNGEALTRTGKIVLVAQP